MQLYCGLAAFGFCHMWFSIYLGLAVLLILYRLGLVCPPATADFYCAKSTGKLMRDYADEIIRYVQKQMTGSKVSLGVEDSVAKGVRKA